MSSAFVLTTFLRLIEIKKMTYSSLNSFVLGCIAASGSPPAAPTPFDRAYVESLKGVSLLAFVVWFWGVMSSLNFFLMV
jgi:hypothetical protein